LSCSGDKLFDGIFVVHMAAVANHQRSLTADCYSYIFSRLERGVRHNTSSSNNSFLNKQKKIDGKIFPTVPF
jgi:hypothetical protein